MVSRKLSDLDDDDDLESSMEGRIPPHAQPPPEHTDQQPPPSPSQPPVHTDQQPPQPPANQHQKPDPETELTLYSYLQRTQAPPQLPLPPPPHASASRRNRRKPSQPPRPGKSPIIMPPFRWATYHRAQVHSLMYLTKYRIKSISGDVECKHCMKKYKIEYNLVEKYKELIGHVVSHSCEFHDRAPREWMIPVLPECEFCHQENSAKPVLKKKRSINWLFLFLGQMLGCCTLDQLNYFCKHTGNNRSGAKDRVLFLTYVELCKQLNRS